MTSEPEPILQRVAERIRSRRLQLALTLRELSATSQVSERFLVSVESGHANLSVAKLDHIARAMDTTAAELCAPEPSEAPAGVAHAHTAAPLVALLGLRGAGKSTIGARAAKRLGLPFFELDSLVIDRAGMSLAELFELHGLAYYRKLERECLEQLIESGARGLVAIGGSLVTDHASFALLRRRCYAIWLKASPEEHMRRVIEQGDARPMANRPGAMRDLRQLLRARRALYERAHAVVDTSTLGLDAATSKVVRIARQCSKTAASPRS